MTRNTFALKVNEGRKQVFREGLGKIWSGITIALDKAGAANFSMWQVDDIVFGYYETKERDGSLCSELKDLFGSMDRCYDWISDPESEMRLMYHDFGVIRQNKELIRHRVFVTRLKDGYEEEYKARHDALVEARGGVPDPGPDSNFSIWYAGGYIMGYDEIDITMEKDETEEDHAGTVKWETKMLEIMDWITDDVDWLTGENHSHVARIGTHG